MKYELRKHGAVTDHNITLQRTRYTSTAIIYSYPYNKLFPILIPTPLHGACMLIANSRSEWR